MRKAWFRLLIIILAVTILGGDNVQTRAAQKKPVPTRNVILIGWDAAQRNHVKECLARKELPNLEKLSHEGSLVAIDIIRMTQTKPGWAQILTGYEPEVTGVFSDDRYQPIPKGLTIFERLEEHFGPENIITVAVVGKKGYIGAPQKTEIKDEANELKNKQAGANIIEEDGVKYRVVPGKPYYYTKDSMDLFEDSLILDEKVGMRAMELLEKYKDKRFFFFVHFAEIDEKGHQYGENSKEYNDALISADTWTGKIIQRLEELKLYDKTLIYVTADHGFDEGMKGHSDAPYVFLATNDPEVMRRGKRADITPTILERFGLDLSKIAPPFDGHPLTRPYKPPVW